MSLPITFEPGATEEHDDEGCPKSVLGKAQLLLAAFGAGAFRLGLTELSRRSGVPKATAYRLAQELTQWGLLERVGDSYQLGLRVFELGQRVPVAAHLRVVARPHLVDLFAATRAAIHLAVLDGSHVLYLEKVAGEANVRTPSDVGARLPTTCTATGKLLLALTADGGDVVDQLRATDLARLTTRSTQSPLVLRRQLAEIRSRRFALEVEETVPGYSSLAVPVTGSDGVVYAAISATLPSPWLSPGRLLPNLVPAATTIARALEKRMLARDGAPRPVSRIA